MSGYEEKLSAFLDGELSEEETRDITEALERDPALQAELETLMALDLGVQEVFAEALNEPVPLELAAAIQNAPLTVPANAPTAPKRVHWGAIAAAVVMLMIGAAGGYMSGASRSVQVAAAPSWLMDITDYHRVYAAQGRHLVEVPAQEADHIETWLTASIGADVNIPDLTAEGLTFQGGRLLVAAGKPVSQLIYTDAQGRVVALCQIQTGSPRDDMAAQSIDEFNLVSWGGSEANFVMIGDTDQTRLRAIAQSAEQQA